jgi:hypothetical protein
MLAGVFVRIFSVPVVAISNAAAGAELNAPNWVAR